MKTAPVPSSWLLRAGAVMQINIHGLMPRYSFWCSPGVFLRLGSDFRRSASFGCVNIVSLRLKEVFFHSCMLLLRIIKSESVSRKALLYTDWPGGKNFVREFLACFLIFYVVLFSGITVTTGCHLKGTWFEKGVELICLWLGWLTVFCFSDFLWVGTGTPSLWEAKRSSG